MKESFWTGNGKNAWIAKAVISSTGHAVARNYLANGDDRDTRLRIGDLGLTMRLDRRLVGMTPEQRLAAQDLAQAMFTDLMRTLGKEVIEGSGITIGSHIECNSQMYRVAKETKLGLHLQLLTHGFPSTTQFHTWDTLKAVNIVHPDTARQMMVREFVNRSCYNWDPEIHLEFLQHWGEETLAQVYLFGGNDHGVRFYLDYEDEVIAERIRPCMALIQNPETLKWVSENTPAVIMRNIANQLLLERTHASTPDP